MVNPFATALAAAKRAFARERPDFKRGPPPQEALDWLKRREVAPAFDYQSTWGEERGNAFYVSKMLERDLLGTVQESLSKAVEEGTPFDEWSSSVESTFDQSGWSDYNGEAADNPARLWIVFDTNVNTARSAGNSERIERVKDAFPFLRYDLGPSKEHTQLCLDLEGLVLPVDDPFWEDHTPPNHFGCASSLTPLTQERAEAEGIDEAPDYEMVEWENADGKKVMMPEGVQPGFGTNQAKERTKRLEALAEED